MGVTGEHDVPRAGQPKVTDCAGFSGLRGLPGTGLPELKPRKPSSNWMTWSPSVLTEALLKSTKSKQFKGE